MGNLKTCIRSGLSSSMKTMCSPVMMPFCLLQVGKTMTQEEAQKIINEVDADKDGKINYNEFVNRVMPDK